MTEPTKRTRTFEINHDLLFVEGGGTQGSVSISPGQIPAHPGDTVEITVTPAPAPASPRVYVDLGEVERCIQAWVHEPEDWDDRCESIFTYVEDNATPARVVGREEVEGLMHHLISRKAIMAGPVVRTINEVFCPFITEHFGGEG